MTHSNVCRVYDIGDFDGQHYLSMEYVDGEDLSSLLRRNGHLPRDKALQIAPLAGSACPVNSRDSSQSSNAGRLMQ